MSHSTGRSIDRKSTFLYIHIFEKKEEEENDAMHTSNKCVIEK